MVSSSSLLFAVSSASTIFVGLASAISGEAKYYEAGLGACGFTSNDSEDVVALSEEQYGTGGHCNKTITVNFRGKKLNATVVDMCGPCFKSSIGLSKSAFTTFAPLTFERIRVRWEYV